MPSNQAPAGKSRTILAMVLNIPVSSTSQVAGNGWGAVGGVGYNFNGRNAVIGESCGTGCIPPAACCNRSKQLLRRLAVSTGTAICMPHWKLGTKSLNQVDKFAAV